MVPNVASMAGMPMREIRKPFIIPQIHDTARAARIPRAMIHAVYPAPASGPIKTCYNQCRHYSGNVGGGDNGQVNTSRQHGYGHRYGQESELGNLAGHGLEVTNRKENGRATGLTSAERRPPKKSPVQLLLDISETSAPLQRIRLNLFNPEREILHVLQLVAI